MSVALVTSATSAMRPCGEIENSRSRTMRAISAIAIGATAATASAKRSFARVSGVPSASAMPWYTSTAAGRTGSGFGRRDRPLVLVDLVAGSVELATALDGRDECIDALGVELRPGAGAQLLERGLLAQRAPVRTGGRHRIERVGDVDDG